MPFLALHLVLTFLLDLVHALTRSPQDQAIEVLLLRQQLHIARRTSSPAPRLSRWEKAPLAALGARCRDLADALVLVQPATVLR